MSCCKVGATNSTVGGATAPARNLISGNSGSGVGIQGNDTTGNVIEGNYIGTNAAGTTALGNKFGVNISGASGNTVGGTTAGAGNVISGNSTGVAIQQSGTTNNVIESNSIGTDATGTIAIANTFGVNILGSASGNTIGGTTAAARNVISGNGSIGVSIQGSGTTNNSVEGNYIGTDVTGTTALANTIGVVIFGRASSNTVGGTAAGAGNLISGNTKGFGVSISDPGTASNLIEGNLIGTNANGTAALANTVGVNIINGASGNTIGGTAAGAGNTIAFNTAFGVSIGGNATVNNAVLGNNIHDNGGATGLDLGQDGVTANGTNPRPFPNDGQNYPVLTAVYGSAVTGTLDSIANATFRVEFFASPSGETGGRNGQTFRGFVTATTDGGGHAALTFTAASALPAGSVITATATNVTAGPQMNDTSEFSAPLTIISGITATAGTPQSALINHPFGTALAATVTDGTGAGLANIPVTFTAPASGASGVFTSRPSCIVANGGASVTCLTNVSGIATAPPYTANGTAGPDTVVASVPGLTPTASFMLQNLALITISPATLPSGVVGTAYSQTLTASGGIGTGDTFTVTSGTLPPGLTLSTSGTLSGTPPAAGTSMFTVQVRDSLGNTATQQYTVTISAAPLTSIALTGPGGATALTLKVGQSAALTATGTYADHSMQTIPPGSVQWQSSNSAVVMVDASGNLTVESAGGPVTITGTFNGVTGQIIVTVSAPTPIGITVPPVPQNRPGGAASGSAPAPAPRHDQEDRHCLPSGHRVGARHQVAPPRRPYRHRADRQGTRSGMRPPSRAQRLFRRGDA